MPNEIVKGFPTPAVSKLSGVPLSTLHYWATTDVVAPSLRQSSGRRATLWWSLPDLVAVRAVKALREAGCPLQMLRKAQPTIAKHLKKGTGSDVLFWDGVELLKMSKLGEITSAVRHPGQGVLHFVAIPVSQWAAEAETESDFTVVDLGMVRKRESARKNRRSTGFVAASPG